MPTLPVANESPSNQSKANGPAEGKTSKTQRPKRKGPNLAQIHSRPLPLEIHPLPAFHPSHPLSLLRLAYTWISHILFPPSSHPEELYTGYFSPETRSVHITDPKDVRALWEMGFFGKGTLSRSDPSWLSREKARLRKEVSGTGSGGGGGKKALEDVTNSRREERRLFKLERARVERERIERQRAVEEGREDGSAVAEGAAKLSDGMENGSDLTVAEDASGDVANKGEEESESRPANGSIDGIADRSITPLVEQTQNAESTTNLIHRAADTGRDPGPTDEVEELDFDTENQEHLQLSLEEAFFLSYGLGVLSIYQPPSGGSVDSPVLSPLSSPQPYEATDLLSLFCQHSTFPPFPSSKSPAPDDPFLLNYVTYHHFRSLGWVVRPGMKFSVDYLLYNRGPVFSHAEFAVLIMPSYSDRYWNTPGSRSRRRVSEQKDWWWLHCVNRVQSQVKKTLVLCYVDVPSPWYLQLEGNVNIGDLLRGYKVREFVVRRWLLNRNRD